jgi:hypothetical protein
MSRPKGNNAGEWHLENRERDLSRMIENQATRIMQKRADIMCLESQVVTLREALDAIKRRAPDEDSGMVYDANDMVAIATEALASTTPGPKGDFVNSTKIDISMLSEQEQEDVRAHIRGKIEGNETYKHEMGSGWRCFHCGELFRTPGGARLHFGSTVTTPPLCRQLETRITGLETALEMISGKNDLSAVADNMIETEARNRLYECELLAREALGPDPKGEKETLR